LAAPRSLLATPAMLAQILAILAARTPVQLQTPAILATHVLQLILATHVLPPILAIPVQLLILAIHATHALLNNILLSVLRDAFFDQGNPGEFLPGFFVTCVPSRDAFHVSIDDPEAEICGNVNQLKREINIVNF